MDVVDITGTLFWCKLSSPKSFDTGNELLFVTWLDRVCQVILHVTPDSLNGIEIGGFGGSAPPVDSIVFKEFFGFAISMFRIVILLESMLLWVMGLYEGKEANLEDVHV